MGAASLLHPHVHELDVLNAGGEQELTSRIVQLLEQNVEIISPL